MSATYRSKYEALVGALHEEDNLILACKIVRWGLTEFKVEDPRPWEAVTVSERYASGLATVEELRAAADAVWDADEDPAWDAEDAARAAAQAVAEEAARSAARAATRAADWAAAGAAWDTYSGTAVTTGSARVAAEYAARSAAYKLFFEWALELMIGEKVAA